MDTQDIPLVIFTILAQMSVGAFVVNGILHVFAGRKTGQAKIDKLSDPALYAIGPIMVVALCISLAHLGDPLHALYTCENFGRSWLSREIVFGVAFAVLAIVFSVSHGRKWFSPLLLQLLAGVTALFGLAFILSQGMIYVITTIPGWDSWATPVSFFVTTFLLGSLAVGVDFVAVTTIPRLRSRHGRRHNPAFVPVASLDLRLGPGPPRCAVRGRADLRARARFQRWGGRPVSQPPPVRGWVGFHRGDGPVLRRRRIDSLFPAPHPHWSAPAKRSPRPTTTMLPRLWRSG